MKKFLAYIITFILLTGCVIQEQFVFDKDGSGEYSMAFNMDQIMGMGSDTDSTQKVVDTVITFASFLDEKKDSISQLSKEEQERLELLRPLTFVMNMNDSLQKFDMRLSYAFTSLDEIENFSEAVKAANIKELSELGMGGSSKDSTQSSEASDPSDDLFGSADAYTTKFSAKGFSRMITAEAREKLIKDKDTTSGSDAFDDAIIMRQVYKFPYKIKSVDNPNAKIHADFKGVEVEANMMQLNNNPDIFNIKVKFE
ncbi:MAG: hypothetical protein HKN89_05470 [Eudoraea sp.]|nr:hypothetical protein [Eudoraea sp.]